MGFRVVQALRERWNAGDGRRAFSGRLYDTRLSPPGTGAHRVMMLAPQTFMNRSGQAVRELTAFYKAENENMLIVLDDMSLPLGRLRARADGSAGGHNGLADILTSMGTNELPRLRIGIGCPPPERDQIDFVLSAFSADETEVINVAIQLAADAVEDWVLHGVTYVMDRYNQKPQEQDCVNKTNGS